MSAAAELIDIFCELETPTTPSESEDGMSQIPNKERFEGIESRLGGLESRLYKIDDRLDSIETSIAAGPKKAWSPFAELRGQAWRWIATNKQWVIPVAAICISVAGWFGSGVFKYWLDHRNDAFNDGVDKRINIALSAQGGVLATLHDIQTKVDKANTTLDTLQPFIRDVIDHQFEKAAKLSPQAFGEHLPAMDDLLAVARNQGVKTKPQIIEALSKKLLQVEPNTPKFWPVAAQLISYRSALSTTLQSEVSRAPICIYPSQNLNVNLTNTGFSGCILDLESATMNGVVCTDCIIRYSGGPVAITGLRLIDCVFIFSAPRDRDPEPDGKRLEKTLLASADLGKIDFTL